MQEAIREGKEADFVEITVCSYAVMYHCSSAYGITYGFGGTLLTH